MKILIISGNYPRYPSDRFGWFVHELLRHIQMQGFETVVLAPSCDMCADSETIDGIRIKRFRYFFPKRCQKVAYGYGILQNLKKDPLSLIQLPFFILLGIVRMIKIIRKEKPDLIHVHWLIPAGLFGICAKFLFQTPLIITVHGTDIRIIPAVIRCFLLRFADAIISPHPELTRLITKCGQDVHQIPNLIANNKEINPGSCNSHNKFEGKKIVSFIGRLDSFKDPLTFIHSIPLILQKRSDIAFVIAGDGNLYEDVCKLIESYGIKEDILVLGWYEDTTVLFNKTDIFVSLSQIENIWSLSLVEAMRHAIPCIVTASGTTPEILHNMVDSILIPVNDKESLAETVMILASDESLSRSIGYNGKKMVDNLFDNEKNVAQVIELYQSLISE